MRDIQVEGMETRAGIRAVVETLEPDNFEFTVEARGYKWDVYRFKANGKLGQLAFAAEDPSKEPVKWLIGYIRAGIRTPEEVRDTLETSDLTASPLNPG